MDVRELPIARIRALLAERGIARGEFARACRLSPEHLSRILNGRRVPGELARLRITAGLTTLGLRVPESPVPDEDDANGGHHDRETAPDTP